MYRRFGFKEIKHPERLMEYLQPYPKATSSGKRYENKLGA